MLCVRGRAHPRSRGEHSGSFPVVAGAGGSSPLARGTHAGRPHQYRRGGLIPARAGNTPSRSSMLIECWAHPRSRGEHLLRMAPGHPLRGSSPLARGTLTPKRPTTPPLGLIPARAGNTRRGVIRNRVHGAHPRSRGEHLVILMPALPTAGSSPLARGTRSFLPPPTGNRGLIPARAGNTSTHGTPPPPSGAHPRSRGEHP